MDIVEFDERVLTDAVDVSDSTTNMPDTGVENPGNGGNI